MISEMESQESSIRITICEDVARSELVAMEEDARHASENIKDRREMPSVRPYRNLARVTKF